MDGNREEVVVGRTFGETRERPDVFDFLFRNKECYREGERSVLGVIIEMLGGTNDLIV